MFVNYTDSYTDNRRTPTRPVSSYVTVDGRLEYTAMGDTVHETGPSLSLAVDVQNLLDEKPPATAIFSSFDLGFDPTNASPLGRLVSLQARIRW
jgi:outer membrane receptor protein involved in Fe transport